MPRGRIPLAPCIVLAGLILGCCPTVEAADWSTFGYDAAHTNFSPNPDGLTPATVPNLRIRWLSALGAVSDTQPAYASWVRMGNTHANLVFVGTEHGRVVAVDAGSGHLVWSRQLAARFSPCFENTPDSRFGITATPIVDRKHNRLLVVPGDNAVHALSLSTGREAKGWPVKLGFTPTTHHVWGSPTLVGRKLYVPIASYCDGGFYRGAIALVNAKRRKVVRRWFVLRAGAGGGGIWGWGGVPVDRADGNVYATTGNATSSKQDRDYAEHLVRLSGDLDVLAAHEPVFGPLTGEDADFASAPLLFRPNGCPPLLAAIHKYGEIFVYRRHAIPAGPTQTIAGPGSTGTLAWSPRAQTLYVTGGGDGLKAFRAAPCSLEPAWTVPFKTWAPSPPTVAGDVVYFGNGPKGTLAAVTADTGKVLWRSGNAIHGSVYAAPTVAGGKLFAVSWDKHLYAFDAQP